MNEEARRKMVSIRMMAALKAAIDNAAAARGITVTDLIIEVLEASLPKWSAQQPESGFFDTVEPAPEPSFFD